MKVMEDYPFTKLVIENQLTKQEYNEVLQLLEQLDHMYRQQAEEGLLDFQSLLIHFVGMLNEKLHPLETMRALKKEGYYPSLLKKLVSIHNKYST